jgi:oligopeptide transport system ATP-binding protein
VGETVNGNLLEVRDLKMHFPVKKRFTTSWVKAVDGVTFSVGKGETVGLVGESGCGKSTIGRTILRFYDPTGGSILFDGADITRCDMTPYRTRMQIVFQDPYSSLDPRMSVGEIVGEPLRIQFPKMPRQEREARVLEQMLRVGLNSEHLSRFPHEFSGGQRQRISIARAMVIHPELLVCDEPVSALDVSIQAQIINMLMDLQDQTGIAFLFIAHDLSVVRHISRQIVVMYLGHVMETNTSGDLYAHPLHPYTKALLGSIPVPDPNANRVRTREVLQGEVPSPVTPPSGCVFRTRCKRATEICKVQVPSVTDLGGGHTVACHHLDS